MFQGSRPFGGRLSARLAASVTVAVAAVAVGAGSASAAGLTAHGQLLHLAPGLKLNANQSSNWFGYSQGTLEQGSKLFNSITGDWTVPAATQHTSGQAEASSDWIGIGGGCVDAGCTVTDSTLIQTGTEQDVDATGAPVVLGVVGARPGPVDLDQQHDGRARRPHARLDRRGRQRLRRVEHHDQGRHQGRVVLHDRPVPVDPRHRGVDRGDPARDRHQRRLRRAPQPDQPGFSSGTVNGAAVKLTPSEEMQLIDSNSNVIGTPSAPNAAGSGFDACTWATSCS